MLTVVSQGFAHGAQLSSMLSKLDPVGPLKEALERAHDLSRMRGRVVLRGQGRVLPSA